MNKTLQTLDLDGNGIGPDGAGAMASMMVKNRTLTTLGIANNHIFTDGAMIVRDALLRNTSLECLDIHGNGIKTYLQEELRKAWGGRNQHAIYV